MRLSRKCANNEDTLIDMRGEGELVGLKGPFGGPVHNRSAYAVEDTILYALDAETFSEECAQNSRATRFLSIVSSSDPLDPDLGADGRVVNWFQQPGPSLEWTASRLLACPPSLPIRAAASRMVKEDAAMLVTDDSGKPLGICTDFDLRRRVATGEISVDAPVSELMQSPVYTIPAEISVGSSLLEMMRRGARHLCITEDGTPSTRALGIISERDILLFYGNNPLPILRSVRMAPDIGTLATLRDRVDALLRIGLRSFADIDWYCELIFEINRGLLQRMIELVSERHDFASRACYQLLGSAGRREMLTRGAIDFAIFLPEPAGADLGTYRRLPSELDDALRQCGFAQPVRDAFDDSCDDVDGWQRRFRQWVEHPIESAIHRRLGYFDFEPLQSGCEPGARVRDSLRQALRETPSFTRLLANDALGRLPPLTIFEGSVVDRQGEQSGEFDINTHALLVISDVARVLALDIGDTDALSTLGRLDHARARIPEATRILSDAAKAFRIVLYQRTMNAFRTGGNGDRLSPALLSPTDQALLKFSFSAISRLMSFAARRYGLE